MQKFIFFSLLILITSKLSTIEYAKEIQFDMENNQFEFTAEEDGGIFVYVVFGKSDIVELVFPMEGGDITQDVNAPGISQILGISKGVTYKICLNYTQVSEEKGFIWINPSYNEIKVDLTKKYEWKFDYMDYFGADSKIVYTIDNADKKVTFKFQYNEKVQDKTVKNPFEVCHGTDCKTDIKTYDFEKGESYKINAKVQKIGESNIDYYVLPSFSFEPQNDSFFLRINLLAFALLLLVL
jgi:hypothetical protein